MPQQDPASRLPLPPGVWTSERERIETDSGPFKGYAYQLCFKYEGVRGEELEGKVRLCLSDEMLPLIRAGVRLPLVISVHYELAKDSSAVQDFWRQGWAVLTPYELTEEEVRNPAGDDLKKNLAIVQLGRSLSFVDTRRVAIFGASAGGYQATLLGALTFCLSCIHCVAGLVNLAYNVFYLEHANSRNRSEYLKDRDAFLKRWGEKARADEETPIAVIRDLTGSIVRRLHEFLGEEDYDGPLWRELSPVERVHLVSSPILFSHSTADLITPVNALGDVFVREFSPEDFPEGWTFRPPAVERWETARRTLLDVLPPDETEIFLIPVTGGRSEREYLRFSTSRRYSICVYDEGAPDPGSLHMKRADLFPVDHVPFIAHHFERGLFPEMLTPAKIKQMAETLAGVRAGGAEEGVFASAAACRRDLETAVYAYLSFPRNAEHWKSMLPQSPELQSITDALRLPL